MRCLYSCFFELTSTCSNSSISTSLPSLLFSFSSTGLASLELTVSTLEPRLPELFPKWLDKSPKEPFLMRTALSSLKSRFSSDFCDAELWLFSDNLYFFCIVAAEMAGSLIVPCSALSPSKLAAEDRFDVEVFDSFMFWLESAMLSSLCDCGTTSLVLRDSL